MRFSTLLVGSVAVGSAAAAVTETETPISPFMVESGGELVLDPAINGETQRNDTDTLSQSYLTHAPRGATDSIEPAFHRRQQDSDDPWNTWRRSGTHQDQCGASTFNGDTGPNAPTTGRCEAVRDWAASNPGYWDVFGGMFDGGWYPLVSSGKAGTTACHFAIIHRGALASVGNTDVRDLVHDSLGRYMRDYNGVWRVRSYGLTDCRGVRVAGVWWMLDTLQGIQKGRPL